MYDVLYEHLSRKITLTSEEFTFIRQQFVPQHVPRKGVLLHAGEVCRATVFVERGMLRAYSVDLKGTDHTTQFAPEGSWIGDIYSLLTGEPATLAIEALEDADVLLLDTAASERIYTQVPKFERYQRLLMQNHLVVVYRRLLTAMGATAEAKYDALLAAYPAVAQRVPLHLVASYLGITPESLSRIRARKAGRG
ncbi:MAG: Crp/Fnr family transcriptional regulator [Hymenobacteraceae bacterium]|nr:Crp/Fnr family transcriptional regulator [Hymenobacteraceae bacterium]